MTDGPRQAKGHLPLLVITANVETTWDWGQNGTNGAAFAPLLRSEIALRFVRGGNGTGWRVQQKGDHVADGSRADQ